MFNKIRRSLKAVNILKNMSKNLSTDVNDTFFRDTEINSDGYIMRKNTAHLVSNGLAIAGMSIVDFGDRYVPYIMVDDTFNSMSESTKEFIIQHELGHFKFHQNHLLNGFVRNDDMECEADEYACKKIGVNKSIVALYEIRGVLDTMTFGKNEYGISELDRRIDYIKSLA